MALGLLVVGQAEVAMTGVEGSALAAHLLWGAVAIAALFRRTHPFIFATICVGGLVPAVWFELISTWSVIFPVAAPLAVFGVGLYGKQLRFAVSGALGFAIVAILVFWLNQRTGEATQNYLGFEWVRLITIYLGAAGAGILLRDRSDALTEAKRRFEALPPAETEVQATVARARQQIAREVYVVVRSCLDQIQPAISEARRCLESSPPAARAAGNRARQLSRQAMDEMRHMLGLLRAEAPDPVSAEVPAAPVAQPGRGRRAIELAGSQALVLLVLANGVLNAFFTAADADLIGGDLGLGWRLAGAVITAAAFIPRRRLPWITVIGVPVILFVRIYLLDDRLPLDLFVWAAVFVAGAYLQPRALAAVGGLFVLAAAIGTAWLVEPSTPWQAYVAFGITTVVVWLIGAGCRDRVHQTIELEDFERLEKLRREEESQRAVREEKLAVARELHDLVGHSLTTITLQCAGAERLIPSDLPRAGRILETVAEIAEDANRELADLFVALSGYREQTLPELEDLPDLAAQMRDRGTDLDLETTGDLSTVPAGPGAAAYRILQESLSNAGKYSSGRVEARVDRLPDRIEMLIRNPRGTGEESGYGLGLIGINERAEAYGGRVVAGPDDSGQWRVQVELPLSPTKTSPLS